LPLRFKSRRHTPPDPHCPLWVQRYSRRIARAILASNPWRMFTIQFEKPTPDWGCRSRPSGLCIRVRQRGWPGWVSGVRFTPRPQTTTARP